MEAKVMTPFLSMVVDNDNLLKIDILESNVQNINTLFLLYWKSKIPGITNNLTIFFFYGLFNLKKNLIKFSFDTI